MGATEDANTNARTLEWKQVERSPAAFELHDGAEGMAGLPLAVVRWQKGWGSTLADAEGGGQRWTFKREGFWRPRITVREPGSEENIATFEPRWTGSGVLTLADGVAYRWQGANVWQTSFAWVGADDAPRMTFSGTHGWSKFEGKVEVVANAGDADTALLLAFGWYLLVLHAQDSTTAATIGVTAAIAGGAASSG